MDYSSILVPDPSSIINIMPPTQHPRFWNSLKTIISDYNPDQTSFQSASKQQTRALSIHEYQSVQLLNSVSTNSVFGQHARRGKKVVADLTLAPLFSVRHPYPGLQACFLRRRSRIRRQVFPLAIPRPQSSSSRWRSRQGSLRQWFPRRCPNGRLRLSSQGIRRKDVGC